MTHEELTNIIALKRTEISKAVESPVIVVAPTVQQAMTWCDNNGHNANKAVIMDILNPLYILGKRLQGIDSGRAFILDTPGYDYDKLSVVEEMLENHPANFEIETVLP